VLVATDFVVGVAGAVDVCEHLVVAEKGAVLQELAFCGFGEG